MPENDFQSTWWIEIDWKYSEINVSEDIGLFPNESGILLVDRLTMEKLLEKRGHLHKTALIPVAHLSGYNSIQLHKLIVQANFQFEIQSVATHLKNKFWYSGVNRIEYALDS